MPRVSLVLPAYNEEVVLEKNVRALLDFCVRRLTDYDWRVVIAENGSTDQTAAIGRRLVGELSRLKFYSFGQPGRGRALTRVWNQEAANGAEILAYLDVDLSADLSALPKLIGAIARGADISYGSRFEQGASAKRSVLRELTSRVYRLLARGILDIRASDLQCGFKAVSASAWAKLASRVTHPGWFWDTELILWAERMGMRLSPVAVDWVDQRDKKRKSTVRLAQTVLGYLGNLARTRWKLWRGERVPRS